MRFRERIIFLEPITQADTSGGFTGLAYNPVYECWANVVMDNSQRDYTNFQYSNMTRVNVKIRYNPDFSPQINNKITWRGMLLTIHSSPDLGAKDYIELVCYYDPAVTYTQKYKVEFSATTGGTVAATLSGEAITTGTYVDVNSSVVLTATAAEDYEFTKWSNDSLINPLTITVTADINLIAEFDE